MVLPEVSGAFLEVLGGRRLRQLNPPVGAAYIPLAKDEALGLGNSAKSEEARPAWRATPSEAGPSFSIY